MSRRIPFVMILVVLLAASTAASLDLNLALGANFNGDFDLGDISFSSDTGYTLGLEVAIDIPVIELGAGLEYGFSREASEVELKASYYLLYAIGRFYFGPAYIAARFGYNDISVSSVLEGDFGGGGSWAVGGGVELFQKLKFELLFNRLGGDLSYESWNLRALYTF